MLVCTSTIDECLLVSCERVIKGTVIFKFKYIYIYMYICRTNSTCKFIFTVNMLNYEGMTSHSSFSKAFSNLKITRLDISQAGHLLAGDVPNIKLRKQSFAARHF